MGKINEQRRQDFVGLMSIVDDMAHDYKIEEVKKNGYIRKKRHLGEEILL